ncbi:MAG: glycosyltransferase family 39 protein [bacterium]|nr:glycosyltransferase family 39 protein [bacterium]
MRATITKKQVLLAILVLAFVLRVWNIGVQDFFGDEGVYAFRGVGYLDYLGTSFQTQPIDWYKDQALPSWTHLSFHDFPPLGLLIQHIFFYVFGDSILVARLPAVILGTLSVLLIYGIVRMLFDESLALFSAFLFSIENVMVWIFRTSLLEPTLLFFILLNIYFFFKFLEQHHRHWIWFGITLGCVALTKYTGIFLVPLYIVYILIEKRSLFKNWHLYAAGGIAFVLLMPVIVYNIFLFQATGHFDLQVAYLFGQDTPEWTGLVGKIQAPFSELWRYATQGALDGSGVVGFYGIAGVGGALFGLFSMTYAVYKKKILFKSYFFLILYIVFVTLLLIKIGSAHRFLTLYGLPFIIFFAYGLALLWQKRENVFVPYCLRGIAIVVVGGELFLTVHTNIIAVPDFGIAKLDQYFEQEFKNKESAVMPVADNQHLNAIIEKFAEKKSETKDRAFSMIVYNDNVELPILDWIFYRRFFYHSIPALFVENFTRALVAEGPQYFKDFDIYFVQSTEHTLLNQFKKEKTVGLVFEQDLIKSGETVDAIIYGHDNLPMFKIYKLSTR